MRNAAAVDGHHGLRAASAPRLQVTEILRAMRGKNVIGGDVVCLMPTRDLPSKVTAMVAAAVMHEIVALIADRKINS